LKRHTIHHCIAINKDLFGLCSLEIESLVVLRIMGNMYGQTLEIAELVNVETGRTSN